MVVLKIQILIALFTIFNIFSSVAFCETVYLTDLEGRIEPLTQLVKDGTFVVSRDGYLSFTNKSTKLVFGGDLMDRGPHSLRLLRIFTQLKLRYPDRVVLLWGNRDLNKLSFAVDREEKMMHLQDPSYRDFLSKKIAEQSESLKNPTAIESLNTPANQVTWWASEYGLSAAIEFHRQELQELFKRNISYDEAATDFSDLISNPSREYLAYIKLGQLVHSEGPTVYVHGSLPAQNGFVPESSVVYDNFSEWEQATNQWGKSQINNYIKGLTEGKLRIQSKKIIYYGDALYDSGLKKTMSHNNSVIYGSKFKEGDNYRLPEESILNWLTTNGKTMLVLGHSPVGNVSALLRAKNFLLVMGDTSYSENGVYSKITINGESIKVHGKLENGVLIGYETSVRDQSSPIGLLHGQDLVIATTPDKSAVLFRYEGRNKIESFKSLSEISEASLAMPYFSKNTILENQKRDLLQDLLNRNIFNMDLDVFTAKFLSAKIPVLFSASSSYADPSQEVIVRQLIDSALRQLDPNKVVIITGATDSGPEKIVHELASKYGFYIHGLIVSAAKPETISDKVNSVSWIGHNWSDQPKSGMDLIREYNGYGMILGGGGLLQKGLEYGASIGAKFLLASEVRHGNGAVSASMNFAEQRKDYAFSNVDSLLKLLQKYFRNSLSLSAQEPSCSGLFAY